MCMCVLFGFSFRLFRFVFAVDGFFDGTGHVVFDRGTRCIARFSWFN